MLISGKAIDDFKSERKGIAPPLPTYLRLVPILLYLSILLFVLLNGLFALQLAEAERARESASRQLAEAKAGLLKVGEERKAREAEVKKASDIAAWVEGSRPLQPLIMNIVRSMAPETSLADLQLSRVAENPAQIFLNIRFSSELPTQLDITLERVAAEGFRTFTPQQTVARGELDYKATLIWQDSSLKETPGTPSTP